jgi:uncharacterized membrane protein YgcG
VVEALVLELVAMVVQEDMDVVRAPRLLIPIIFMAKNGEDCGEVNIYNTVTVIAKGGAGGSGGLFSGLNASDTGSGTGGGGYPGAGIGGGGAGGGGGTSEKRWWWIYFWSL